MDDTVRRALSQSSIADITTTGRRTGRPRRIEIGYHVLDGHVYISGMPVAERRRSWLANLEANPRFTLHLKRGTTADLPATARIITEPTERSSILPQIARAWGRTDLDAMIAHSPLIEVSVDGDTPDGA